ncbi:hypothetical protein QAD02_016782 [Eretmocerus hayati]|uniref:Uncharacterized protein n=1 Tax=Eretmocerus hayati TaxID=131215 RepID=A0ACC2PBK2_9HYME|nr:hypothetical protein QAD02_016782 [Eretmocerus hayati]
MSSTSDSDCEIVEIIRLEHGHEDFLCDSDDSDCVIIQEKAKNPKCHSHNYFDYQSVREVVCEHHDDEKTIRASLRNGYGGSPALKNYKTAHAHDVESKGNEGGNICRIYKDNSPSNMENLLESEQPCVEGDRLNPHDGMQAISFSSEVSKLCECAERNQRFVSNGTVSLSSLDSTSSINLGRSASCDPKTAQDVIFSMIADKRIESLEDEVRKTPCDLLSDQNSCETAGILGERINFEDELSSQNRGDNDGLSRPPHSIPILVERNRVTLVKPKKYSKRADIKPPVRRPQGIRRNPPRRCKEVSLQRMRGIADFLYAQNE